MAASPNVPDTLRIVLVAPSRYDRDGVMVFRVGINPNGALGALAGMIEDYDARHGGRRRVRYDIFDEPVREAITASLLRGWRDAARARGERLVVMVCGVQTPFYPRARDIALLAKREGVAVAVGGVHFTAHGPSAEFLARCGVSVGIGEVEPIWDRLLDDAFRDALAPIYRLGPEDGLRVKTAVEDIRAPDLWDAPYPVNPREYRSRYLNAQHVFIDASRGCPFVCSFCSVKNTTGRTVRGRNPARLVEWMGEQVRAGNARWFTFSDDNFIRNPHHLEVLEGLAALRREGLQFSLCMSLDVVSACYADEDSPRGRRTRRFLELCRAAGLSNVSMGLESTNDEALQEMDKDLNRDRTAARAEAHAALLQRYRTAVRAYQAIGASVECGYIIGFDADRRGAGRRAADDMTAIGMDTVNFNLLVPLPGAEDYMRALRDDRLLIRDFNEFYSGKAMIAHPELTSAEIEAEFGDGMRRFYSWRRVFGRLARGLFGIGRPRVQGPWIFAKRQLGYKLMLLSGMRGYAEGGLGRRPSRVRREAVTDREALAFYLGREQPAGPAVLPPEALDERRMESLPVLLRHAMPPPAGARRVATAS